ncbi:hypothetical protein DL766_008652 [Monosporascus sp. MC13-8B]|uniref:Uncharacterized protein n=1 Tax=Monosporascus cannonballus TaxID=155416 RepID=A0ABY0GZY4_9PEZI|nr:hypothetical protein DL762_008684 [Monosporascus cannonballus]RYO78893.1 hypothetical protein DL763_009478 [Monosporascus cannonballus]RYP18498.1 hypothetical protein DL766_008652 [Monosporascus sp. MC13-8B]
MDTTTRHEQDTGGRQPSSPPPLPPKSSPSHRGLVKGALKSPATKRPEHPKSYTLPKTDGEVTIRKAADRKRRRLAAYGNRNVGEEAGLRHGSGGDVRRPAALYSRLRRLAPQIHYRLQAEGALTMSGPAIKGAPPEPI